MKLSTAKLYISNWKWWVFIFQVFGEKKNKTKIPTQIFGILGSVAEGKQTYFFRPNVLLKYDNENSEMRKWKFEDATL